MSLKVIVAAIAAGSIGMNVYQWLNNRGLKALLADKGMTGANQCEILKRAVNDLQDEIGTLKADLNQLIDDITAGKVAPADVPERIMQVYRKASKEAPAKEADKPADAPKSDAAGEAPKPNAETPTGSQK